MIWLIFLLLIAVPLVALIQLFCKGLGPGWLKIGYLIFCAAAVLLAFYTTFNYVYWSNKYTQHHGWPVPTVIFQEDKETGVVRDFVGLTTILAFPLNVALFVFLPSLIVCFAAGLRKFRSWRLNEHKS